MGCGNCCVFGRYEGLYYIDNDDFHVFRRADAASDDCPEPPPDAGIWTMKN